MILYNYIRRRSNDDVAFIKFNHNFNFIFDNFNFIFDDILLDIVTCSRSHENYNSCRMYFVCDEIVNNLMK